MVFALLVFPSLNPGAVRAMVRGNILPWCSRTGWPPVWGAWRLPRLDWARNTGSISSPGWKPFLRSTWSPRGWGEHFPQKTSLSASSKHLPPLEKHLCFVPELYHYSSNMCAKSKPRTFKSPCCIFKWLYWTKINQTNLPKIWWYDGTR